MFEYNTKFIKKQINLLRGIVAKKNSKKNKFKAKDRFRSSIITNESTASDSSQDVSTSTKVASTTVNSVGSVRINSLGTELKLIGLIGSVLVSILVIASFII